MKHLLLLAARLSVPVFGMQNGSTPDFQKPMFHPYALPDLEEFAKNPNPAIQKMAADATDAIQKKP